MPILPGPAQWAISLRMLVAAVVAALVIRWLIRDSRGFVPTHVASWWKAAVWVVAGVAVMIGPQLATPMSEETQQVVAEGVAHLGLREGSLGNLGIVLGTVLFAPVAEELIYRAMVFGGWRELFRQFMSPGLAAGVAAVISGMAFSFAHFSINPFQSFIYIIAGVVWALAYHFTKSLLVPVFIHAVGNSFQFWLMLHGPNRAFDGGAANLAVLLVSPFAAVGLAWLLTRLFRTGQTRQVS